MKMSILLKYYVIQMKLLKIKMLKFATIQNFMIVYLLIWLLLVLNIEEKMFNFSKYY